MSKLLVVVGISGVQGSSVANTFLAHKDWKVRGTTRNVNSAKSQEWKDKGVEIVAADVEDVESLKEAFKGATHIFGLTDFWSPIKDPNTWAKLNGQAINQYAYDLEVKQGINLANAAASVPDLQRYVYSALPDPNEWPQPEQYSNLLHFHSKRPSSKYIKENLPELYSKYNEVQLSVYNENFTTPASGPMLIDGKTYINYFNDGNNRIFHTAAGRDTGPAVFALVTKGEPGTDLLIDSDDVSIAEALDIISEVNNIPVGGVKNLGPEGFASSFGFPEPLGTELYQNHLFLEAYNKSVKQGRKVLRLQDLGVKGTNFRDWVSSTKFPQFKTE